MTVRVLPRLLIAASAIPLAACSAQMDEERGVTAPAVKVVGEPVNCIQTNRIRNTNVHDNQTIDFEMSGGKLYRNTLPRSCPSLGFEKRFSYKTSTGQLCSTDIIYVLDTNGQQGAGCGLGQFVPVELAETE
ncbi:hypothetical protein FHS61_000462 [Altererythrobacter atlanticus]|uniref:Uncharacterized protein n=1 Tax=Croceibacterium atlanticum TaxID=1267766 RepID=A0A0F7KTW8_9SPHN|nr:hypothetical protein [Croceibacterium atlanticum]AKH42692.1 hypothetical protein WYH_01656 [Croceibacterium atlanticum]MBB5731469.1 hypothetical protein [Croceibacterium atlanticum]